MILLNGQEIEFNVFPNGETRLEREDVISKIEEYSSQNVAFKYENDSDLIKLLILKNYLDDLGFSNLTHLTVYYMPYSRQDRTENESPFTLKYIARFINMMGFRKVEVIEPHSDVTPALLDKAKSTYINFDLLPLVMEEIGFDKENDYIMFPDSGAAKRYGKMKVQNVLTGNKHRDFATGKIERLELVGYVAPEANKVLILDDLSSFGGTFYMSAEALKEAGFKEVYLLVAHAENSIFAGKLLQSESPIDKVFTTDSHLTAQKDWKNLGYIDKKLKIYPIHEVLAP